MASIRRGDEPTAAPSESPVTVATVASAAAPGRHYREIAFDLVLAPGFRLLGDTGEPVENHFVLGIVGHSDRVSGVQLSAAGNIAQDGVTGAQVGGGFALSYGPVRGAQIASYSMALGGVHGVQASWIASVAMGPVIGAQVSTINVANGSMRGVQVGLANIQQGGLDGAQVGLVNVDRPVTQSRGVQVGLANLTRGSGERSAASVGLVNVARKQHGVQVGLVNVADEFDGVQVGLVSVARKNSGVSIGLLPIVLDGENHATLEWNSTSAATLGFKLGTRHVYVAAGFGITRDLEQDGSRLYSTTFGIGAHVLPRDRRFFLDVDISNTGFVSSGPSQAPLWVSALRLQAGFAVARHLAVVIGPSMNFQQAKTSDDRRPRNVSFAEQVWTTSSHTLRLYPGFSAGLEF
jgi:hypothetical protein